MSIVGMDQHVRNSFLEATDRRGRPLRLGKRCQEPFPCICQRSKKRCQVNEKVSG